VTNPGGLRAHVLISVGDPDPEPDPDLSEVWILPFSHKDVEWTEVMLAK
jgi:hypothetical protein